MMLKSLDGSGITLDDVLQKIRSVPCLQKRMEEQPVSTMQQKALERLEYTPFEMTFLQKKTFWVI